MKITALAGGVGGAKLANGLSKILPPEDLSIIVNTGDDFEYLGFYITPDVDTVIYNLAGINNPLTGYGITNDTYNVINGLERLGHEIWFRIGDSDIATQIERTRLIKSGLKLSAVTEEISRRFGVKNHIFPMCEEPVQTQIVTDKNTKLSFQEYFVKFRFQPVVEQIIFTGSEKALLPPQVQACLEASDAVIICPSNPYLSIDPILSIQGVKDILIKKTVIAVSPLIGGQAVKGPAAKIMSELGIEAISTSIARHYRDFLTGFVIDMKDQQEKEQISRWGIIPFVTEIYMQDVNAQIDLAKKVINFYKSIL